MFKLMRLDTLLRTYGIIIMMNLNKCRFFSFSFTVIILQSTMATDMTIKHIQKLVETSSWIDKIITSSDNGNRSLTSGRETRNKGTNGKNKASFMQAVMMKFAGGSCFLG